MKLKKWENLPENMKNDQVKPYYDYLATKRFSLFVKRLFDVLIATLLFVLLFPILLLIGLVIKFDSKGPVLFRQARVTQYGEVFLVLKFRTMIHRPEGSGALVTSLNDKRITTTGSFLRKLRLDELPQLMNIMKGDMSFVGTRPEVEKYVSGYTNEMMATLLLPAGVTSKASIYYKDEDELLANADNVDTKYIEDVLPEKMKYNLDSLMTFHFFSELKTMTKTVVAVISK